MLKYYNGISWQCSKRINRIYIFDQSKVLNREHKCHLISTQSYPSGLVQLKYDVVK